MDDPGFLIEEIEPGIEGGIGIKVLELMREFKAAGLEFGAEEGDNSITPDGFEDSMMKISVSNPAFIIQRQAAGCSGKMNMEITFEIAAESMIGRVDARDEMLLGGKVFNDVGRDRTKFIEKATVEPEERLKMIRQGKRDVLPKGVREDIKSGFDPIISVLFAAGGTETGFTGMRRLDRMEAFWADKNMPAKQRSPAGKHFENINDNGLAHQLAGGEKKFPPVAVINEDIPDFNLTADEFHKGNIAN